MNTRESGLTATRHGEQCQCVCALTEPLAVWGIGLYGYIYNALAQHRPGAVPGKQGLAV
jgi:hypothetical protein